MPSREELQLLAMLQAERQRNAAAAKTESPLPDLKPEMLMSPAALREMQAAMNFAAPLTFPLPQQQPGAAPPPVHAIPPPPPRAAADRLRGMNDHIQWTDDAWDINLDEPEASTTTAMDHTLESIFMGRAMAEVGASEGDIYASAPGPYEEPMPRRAMAPPPRASLRPSRDDVRVVSRRDEGRWQASPAPRSAGTTTLTPSPRSAVPAPSRQAPPPARVAPTVYEHLLADPFDD